MTARLSLDHKLARFGQEWTRPVYLAVEIADVRLLVGYGWLERRRVRHPSPGRGAQVVAEYRLTDAGLRHLAELTR